MMRAPAFLFWAILFTLVFGQTALVAGYIGHERTIYFWDHAMYFAMAKNFYDVWSHDASAGWAALQNSFSENYNYIFALPSLVTFSLFGPSRLVFILTNFFVFFLGYECAVAYFLSRALGWPGKKALLVSLVGSSLIPPLWLPLLEGYPDNGAAACIALAAAIGWAGPASRKYVARALGLGLALAGAVLLRRHFAYPAEALLLALGLMSIWDLVRASKDRGHLLWRTAIYYVLCGLAMVGLLAVVAPAFIVNALTIDYNSLYQSYRRPPGLFLYFTLGGFGAGLFLVAVTGLVRLARLSETGKRAAIITLLFVLSWLVLWSIGPDQMGHHYMLHALPLAITLGFAGWLPFCEAKRTSEKKCVAVAALFLLLTANSAWALWLSPSGVWPNDNGTPGFLSAPRPPVVRNDIDQWMKLAEYLARTTTDGDRIMVVGSSFVFNQDIFHNIYMNNPATAGMVFRFPKSPEIDHEEPAPLDVFASSTVYVVPTPAQYHLDPSGQRVITAAANQFPPPAARQSMFTVDDVSFPLENGSEVKIWRRPKAWTPVLLRPALAQIRHDAAADARFAQGWVVLDMPLRSQIYTAPDNRSVAAGLFAPAHREMKILFDQPIQQGDSRVAFELNGSCPDPQFRLSVVEADGQVAFAKDFSAIVMPGAVFQPFTAAAAHHGDQFLQLAITTHAAALCQLELRDLRIEKN